MWPRSFWSTQSLTLQDCILSTYSVWWLSQRTFHGSACLFQNIKFYFRVLLLEILLADSWILLVSFCKFCYVEHVYYYAVSLDLIPLSPCKVWH